MTKLGEQAEAKVVPSSSLVEVEVEVGVEVEVEVEVDTTLSFRHSLDGVEILFRLGVGGKIIPRIRLTSAKDLVEVEAELGN